MNITSRALGELKRILTSSVDNSYARLRLVSNGQESLGLGIDVESPGDKVFEYEGSGLLVVDEGLVTGLEGVTIDVDDTYEGLRIVFVKTR
ncbi:hypothetical protein ACFLVH_02405 [Chloroflexota bacterium]